MDCIIRDFTEEDGTAVSSSSLSEETLLFATMCITGLPVDVHVTDGSIYSGIFHTASLENQYGGIVLKKARMTKMGKNNANVANGALIDTLVILSAHLVQVVAKGVLLPADGVAANMSTHRTEAVTGGTVSSFSNNGTKKKPIETGIHEKKGVRVLLQNGNGFANGVTHKRAGNEHGGRKLPHNHIGNNSEIDYGKHNEETLSEIRESSGARTSMRQVEDDGSQGKQDDINQKLVIHMEENADKVRDTKITSKLLPLRVSCDPATVVGQQDNQCNQQISSEYTSSGSNAVSPPGASTKLNPDASVSSRTETTSTEMIPHSSKLNKSAKEFKLNPGAKVFSPSFTKPIATTSPPVPTVASMGFIPTNCPAVPAPQVQTEVGTNPFPSRTSVPVKVLPYNNFTSGNGGSSSQFSQPIIGHMSSTVQTVRYAGQYPVQAGPTYVHPNSQAVMVGRFGQLVYVHPVSQDLVQGTPAISPLSARPMLTPHQVQFPKHQGTAGQALPLCVPPQFMATGQQPFPVAKLHPIFATSLPF